MSMEKIPDNNQKRGATTKGRIQVIATREQMEFQYNPEQMGYNRGAKFNTIQGSGSAYPKFQFCSGGEAEFSLSLLLDGTFGKLDKLEEQRAFLRKLLPPEDSNASFVAPIVFVVIMGKDIRKAFGVNLKEDITDFSEDLRPRLMTVVIDCKEVR